MKKIFVIIAALVLVFGMTKLASADVISFIQLLEGVDPDTSGWSADNTMVNLGVSSWSLLGGWGSVDSFGGDLTHRGTRGLGVFGNENDEIDNFGRPESIEVTFNRPYFLNSLEVRSLFDEPNMAEEGQVDFYLSNVLVGGQHLVGLEAPGTNGVSSFAYGSPLTIDKLVFYVPGDQSYTPTSEFALAKLGVTAVPEPISAALFLLGGGTMALRQYRKKNKKV